MNSIPSKIVSFESEKSSNDIQQTINSETTNNGVNVVEDTDEYIDCLNTHKDCLKWSLEGECDANPLYMLIQCAKSCNSCSKQTQEFRSNYCKDKWQNKQECKKWSSEGECDANPSFMREQCSKSCKFCDYETRCKPYTKYQSAFNLTERPSPSLFETLYEQILFNKFIFWKYNVSLISFDPPIFAFNNFIPPQIADLFVNETNDIINFTRSSDAGELDENFVYKPIISKTRTSTNGWCHGECSKLESTKTIMRSIYEITKINKINYEQLQILNYEIGQHYKEHHDFIDIQYDMRCGPRILTLFIYLNDVEKGGETAFPKLNISVKPQKGKAILWPSVLNNDPFSKLSETHHAALDVIEGNKKAVNVWIHLFDFDTPYKYGCTG